MRQIHAYKKAIKNIKHNSYRSYFGKVSKHIFNFSRGTIPHDSNCGPPNYLFAGSEDVSDEYGKEIL